MLGLGLGLQYPRRVVGGGGGLPPVLLNSELDLSLRKLYPNYNGDILSVRRDNNDIANIGFSGNEVDIASLLAFANGGNVRATDWWFQNGSGLKASNTNAATQPIIVNNGVVNLSNGKPALKFTKTGEEYLFVNVPNLNSADDFLMSSVFEFLQTDNFFEMICGFRQAPQTATNGAAVFQLIGYGLEIGIHHTDVAGTTINVDITSRLGQKLGSVGRTGGIDGNGGSVTVVSTGNSQPTYDTTANQTWASNVTTGFQIGGRQQNGTMYGDKHISEVIAWSNNLNLADRQVLELNQSEFYGITI